jgi:NAD(P)-dependent dehydrogenase (short-subunit alcohol dehydrogenase family)
MQCDVTLTLTLPKPGNRQAVGVHGTRWLELGQYIKRWPPSLLPRRDFVHYSDHGYLQRLGSVHHGDFCRREIWRSHSWESWCVISSAKQRLRLMKTVVLVGVGPGSLGQSMATAFAKHSPEMIILASRTASKLEAIAQELHTIDTELQIKQVVVDLASQSSVHKAAEAIEGLTSHVDILINNAAVTPPEHRTTPEGVELQFATNFLGPFLLTNLLMPLLIKSAEGSSDGSTRIISVSSKGHVLGPIRFSDVNFRMPNSSLPESERYSEALPPQYRPGDGETFHAVLAYAQSKSANILFSSYLDDKLKGKGIRAYSMHPGTIMTGLSRELDEAMIQAMKAAVKFWKNLDQGSATMMVAALDPALNATDKTYLQDCQLAEPAPHATGMDKATRLWALAEDMVGQKFVL